MHMRFSSRPRYRTATSDARVSLPRLSETFRERLLFDRDVPSRELLCNRRIGDWGPTG